ncbi:MAG: class I adenylate-forming enzyme family protein [Gemmatimonadota bacterium]
MDPLRDAATRDATAPALAGPSAETGEDVSWSWVELDREADAAALRLAGAGVGAGDLVAMVLPPSPEAVALLHAVPRAGGILVPLHTGWTDEELRRAMAGVGRPRLLLAPSHRVPALRRVLRPLGIIPVAEITGHGLPPEDGTTVRPALPELATDTPLALLLTSGTTGSPRPVPLTHGNLMASAHGVAERLRLDPMDRWLASLAPAHVGGLALLHRAAVVGSEVILRERFRAEEFLALAADGRITHASLVPVMLRRVVDAAGSAPAPRALRCLLLGGAATPPKLLQEALQARWPVALTYGLTEASSQVATAPPEAVRRKPGSVGRPLSGVGVAIRTPDPSTPGEILVRGPTVALLSPVPPGGPGDGRTSPSVRLDAEGWLHTGDLGTFDEDGELRVTGRLSDRIVSGGVTVEPGEVEAVLLGHPGVGDAVVIGVPDPDWGERIVAFVQPMVRDEPPSPEALAEYASGRLSSSKRPRRFILVDTLPRTVTGKIDRAALRAHTG